MSNAKLYRDETISRLLGATTAGANVFRSRIDPVRKNKMPAIVVYTPEEDYALIGGPNQHPTFEVTATLSIDVMVMLDDDWDDTIDTIHGEIATLLFSDPEWVSCIGTIDSARRAMTIADIESEKYIMTSRFDIILKSEVDYPPTVEDDLENARINVDLIDPSRVPGTPGPDGIYEAELDIDIDTD